MKLEKAQINGYGNLENVNVEFTDGINIIRGNNESGKSTLGHFIKAMLYGVNRNKGKSAYSEIERFKPWSNGDFSGKIEYTHERQKFSVFRDFNRNNTKVFDVEGNEITALFNKDKMRGAELGFTHLGIDEETFVNSVFISQASSTVETNERNSLIQKITNIIQSGDEAISYDKAKLKLHKFLLDEVGTERTYNKPINTVVREIDTLEKMQNELISDREKKEEIIIKKKIATQKIKEEKKKLESIKKVFEIKDRYSKMIIDREKEYEISLKVFEKEKEEKIESRKRTKRFIMFGAITITLIIAITLFFLKIKYIPMGILLIGVISAFCIDKFFPMDVTTSTIQDIDVTRENLKRKEKKELSNLNGDEICEKLLEKKVNDISSLLYEKEKELNDLTLEEHKLYIEEEALNEKVGRLNDIEEQLSELYEKEEDLRKLEFSIKLAEDVLYKSYEEIKAKIVPDIEQNIKKNIERTTNGQYANVIYNDKLGLLTENVLGETITINKLSMGTIDQIYLGFRMAIAEKIGEAPLFLDETFAYYDDERLENILKVLEKQGNRVQIFIMTCSTREKNILDKLKIKYNEIVI